MEKAVLFFIFLFFIGILNVSAYSEEILSNRDIFDFFSQNNNMPSCNIDDEFCFTGDEEGFGQAAEPGSLIAFETTDLAGNEVNSAEIFSRQKVTMIKIWSTTCYQCIQEMPELVKLNREFKPLGAQIIGVIYDADESDEIQEAREIIEFLDVDFPNLLPNKLIQSLFRTQAFPSTLFVDEGGRILGDPLMGAKTGMYPELVRKYLTETAQ